MLDELIKVFLEAYSVSRLDKIYRKNYPEETEMYFKEMKEPIQKLNSAVEEFYRRFYEVKERA